MKSTFYERQQIRTISVLNLAISPLLLKPAAQKEKMYWNSLTRSSRLCATPVAVPVVLWSLSLFCYVSFRMRVALVFRDIIYIINILYS
jgi:hypothetical protein